MRNLVTSPIFLSVATSLVAIPTVLSQSACDLLAQPVEIPVSLVSPSITIDVTNAITVLEADLCTQPDSENCLVLQALDQTDDGAVSTPPSIPDEFPTSVTIEQEGAQIEIDCRDWLDSSGLISAAQFKKLVNIDVTEEAEVETPDAIQNVRITALSLQWPQNTLTFPTVPLDFYVATETFEDDADPAALIAEGKVTKVGSIDAQAAGSVSDLNINFVEGGANTFSDAVRSLKFAVVVALPDGVDLSLPAGANPDTLVKPQGLAEVAVKADFVLTLTANSVIPGDNNGDGQDDNADAGAADSADAGAE